MRTSKDRTGNSIIGLLFALQLVMHLAIAPDFACNWDETNNRQFGIESLGYAKHYVETGRPAVQSYGAEHGTAFETVLVLAERALGSRYEDDPARIHRMRHLIIMLFMLVGAYCFFLFCRDYFQSWRLGLLGAALLLWHPLIFGHSFGNSMDISFLSACCIAFHTLFRFVETGRLRWTAAHALASAFAIDIRIVGVLLGGMSVSVLLLNAWRRGRPALRTVELVGLYLALSSIAVVAFWSFLWGAPLSNFVWALRSMSNLTYSDTMLYFGHRVSTLGLPWHYNLGWIALTTPPIIVVLFFVGAVGRITAWLRSPILLKGGEDGVIVMLGWLIISLAAPMLLHSVLFDSWRHHFFVYPAIVFLSLVGLRSVFDLSDKVLGRRARAFKGGAVAALLGYLLLLIVRLHPYEALYFNSIANLVGRPDRSRGLEQSFDVDYWGLSYREGLEYLARYTEGPFRVYRTSQALTVNAMWLSKKDRERLILVDRLADAQYFMSGYRYVDKEYPQEYGQEIYRRMIGNTKVLTVRQR
jgi:hypothetical protein